MWALQKYPTWTLSCEFTDTRDDTRSVSHIALSLFSSEAQLGRDLVLRHRSTLIAFRLPTLTSRNLVPSSISTLQCFKNVPSCFWANAERDGTLGRGRVVSHNMEVKRWTHKTGEEEKNTNNNAQCDFFLFYHLQVSTITSNFLASSSWLTTGGRSSEAIFFSCCRWECEVESWCTLQLLRKRTFNRFNFSAQTSRQPRILDYVCRRSKVKSSNEGTKTSSEKNVALVFLFSSR